MNDGANVNAKKNDGETALMLAAWRGHTQIAELLIKYGAEVNAKTTGGNTALILAGKNTETAYILRSHGAKE
ncbi:MAG: ankyrin repeat domain-containing protein [Synergistaceae bacterium]|nr:ankyrin repeat domain-containing protein [Synergistaceae bacterium]